MIEVSHYECVLPRLPRSLVIEKGRDGPYAVAVSRNGRVLFLSERPLGDLAGRQVVLAVRPWLRSEGGARRTRGTSVLVRMRAPARHAVTPTEAVVAPAAPGACLACLPLSPRGVLAFVTQSPNPSAPARA